MTNARNFSEICRTKRKAQSGPIKDYEQIKPAERVEIYWLSSRERSKVITKLFVGGNVSYLKGVRSA